MKVQFLERRKKATEFVPEFGQALRRLSNLAYQTAPRDVRETLAKEQFVDCLPDSDMRLEVKESRPTSLDEAIKLAVELESLKQVETANRSANGHLRMIDSIPKSDGNSSRTRQLDSTIEKLEKSIRSLKNIVNHLAIRVEKVQSCANRSMKSKQGANEEQCFYHCGESNHFIRDYPSLPRYRNNNRRGRGNGNNQPYRGGSSRIVRNWRKPSVSIVDEAEIYIDVCLGGSELKFLVDTSATLSIVSTDLREIDEQTNTSGMFATEKFCKWWFVSRERQRII